MFIEPSSPWADAELSKPFLQTAPEQLPCPRPHMNRGTTRKSPSCLLRPIPHLYDDVCAPSDAAREPAHFRVVGYRNALRADEQALLRPHLARRLSRAYSRTRRPCAALGGGAAVLQCSRH